MPRRSAVILPMLASLVSAAPASMAKRQGPPSTLGTCRFTTIGWVGQRLGDGSGHRLTPSSGSAISLADGVRGVSYDDVPAVERSRVGDPVMTCLAKLPTHCPPGDARGRWYVTTNLRTNEAWTLPDAEHSCGGA